MAIVSREDEEWASTIPRGDEHVPQLPPALTTPATQEARKRYVEAWNEWRYRPSFTNGMNRDSARRFFYITIGQAALGDAVPNGDHGDLR